MLSHQDVALFEQIKRIGRCGLVGGGNVSLGVGFEASKAHAKSRVSLFLLFADPNVEFSRLTAMAIVN